MVDRELARLTEETGAVDRGKVAVNHEKQEFESWKLSIWFQGMKYIA